MANFKVGQKVVYVKDGGFVDGQIYKKGDITIIKEFNKLPTYKCDCGREDHFIKVTEGTVCYCDIAPIQYQSATAEILEKFKLTEEKADVKVKEVETV